MRIALVRHVKHNFVLWSVKHIVQSHSSLGETKVGTHVSAMHAHTVEHTFTHFIGKHIELVDAQAFHVFRAVDFLYNHIYFSFFKFFEFVFISGVTP